MGSTIGPAFASEGADHSADLEEIAAQVLLAIRSISYGSVEIVIHDSRVVQIERKEKLRIGKDPPHKWKANNQTR